MLNVDFQHTSSFVHKGGGVVSISTIVAIVTIAVVDIVAVVVVVAIDAVGWEEWCILITA